MKKIKDEHKKWQSNNIYFSENWMNEFYSKKKKKKRMKERLEMNA